MERKSEDGLTGEKTISRSPFPKSANKTPQTPQAVKGNIRRVLSGRIYKCLKSREKKRNNSELSESDTAKNCAPLCHRSGKDSSSGIGLVDRPAYKLGFVKFGGARGGIRLYISDLGGLNPPGDG